MTPERLGIPSRAVSRFLNRMAVQGVCLHGIKLMRYGETVAEGYWAPYAPSQLHRMFSVSKSITSLAIGLMMDEGRLRLDEPIAPHFAGEYREPLHPWLAQTTVRDLLTMAIPHTQTTYAPADASWVRTFFDTAPSHPPGTVFHYNTSATVMLCALVERLSGQRLLDYMRPRLLDPIGFSPDTDCIMTPEGVSWGGSGVLCRLEDLARLGQLCMQEGMWKGRQMISADYIRAATARQIDNGESGGACDGRGLGYGYQIWRTREDGFHFFGMGSQHVFCFPGRQFMVACIGDTQLQRDRATDALTDGVFDDLYAALSDAPLPEAPAEAEALRARLASLAIQPVQGETHVPMAEAVSGVTYRLAPNPMGIDWVQVSLGADAGEFVYGKGGARKRIAFGLGHLVGGVFPEVYNGRRIGRPAARGFDCYASAAWVEPHKLCLLVHILDEHLGGLRVTLSYKGDAIGVYMMKAAEWFLEDYQGFAGGEAVAP